MRRVWVANCCWLPLATPAESLKRRPWVLWQHLTKCYPCKHFRALSMLALQKGAAWDEKRLLGALQQSVPQNGRVHLHIIEKCRSCPSQCEAKTGELLVTLIMFIDVFWKKWLIEGECYSYYSCWSSGDLGASTRGPPKRINMIGISPSQGTTLDGDDEDNWSVEQDSIRTRTLRGRRATSHHLTLPFSSLFFRGRGGGWKVSLFTCCFGGSSFLVCLLFLLILDCCVFLLSIFLLSVDSSSSLVLFSLLQSHYSSSFSSYFSSSSSAEPYSSSSTFS